MKNIFKKLSITLFLIASFAIFAPTKNYGQCIPRVTNGFWHPGYNAFVCLGEGDVICVIACSGNEK